MSSVVQNPYMSRPPGNRVSRSARELLSGVWRCVCEESLCAKRREVKARGGPAGCQVLHGRIVWECWDALRCDAMWQCHVAMPCHPRPELIFRAQGCAERGMGRYTKPDPNSTASSRQMHTQTHTHALHSALVPFPVLGRQAVIF